MIRLMCLQSSIQYDVHLGTTPDQDQSSIGWGLQGSTMSGWGAGVVESSIRHHIIKYRRGILDIYISGEQLLEPSWRLGHVQSRFVTNYTTLFRVLALSKYVRWSDCKQSRGFERVHYAIRVNFYENCRKGSLSMSLI